MSSNLSDILTFTGDRLEHPLQTTLAKGFLTGTEIGVLSTVSLGLFKDLRFSRETVILHHFLSWVAHGDQDKAEAFLRSPLGASPKWLQTALEFSDHSGRIFNCTAYEYAHWAKDAHMCRMLQRYMDADTKTLMFQKVNDIEASGLAFDHDGDLERSSHFDLSHLIDTLQLHTSGYQTWYDTHDWNSINAAWGLVGDAQSNLPAHIAQEYCRLDKMCLNPKSISEEPSFARTLNVIDSNTDTDYSWYSLLASHAEEENGGALARLTKDSPYFTTDGIMATPGACQSDLNALNRLNTIRDSDLKVLHEQLHPIHQVPDIAMS